MAKIFLLPLSAYDSRLFTDVTDRDVGLPLITTIGVDRAVFDELTVFARLVLPKFGPKKSVTADVGFMIFASPDGTTLVTLTVEPTTAADTRTGIVAIVTRLASVEQSPTNVHEFSFIFPLFPTFIHWKPLLRVGPGFPASVLYCCAPRNRVIYELFHERVARENIDAGVPG